MKRFLTPVETDIVNSVLKGLLKKLGSDEFLRQVKDIEVFYDTYFKGLINGLTNNSHDDIKERVIERIDVQTCFASLDTLTMSKHLMALADNALEGLGLDDLRDDLENDNSHLFAEYFSFNSLHIFGEVVADFDNRLFNADSCMEGYNVVASGFFSACKWLSLDNYSRKMMINAYDLGFKDSMGSGYCGVENHIIRLHCAVDLD